MANRGVAWIDSLQPLQSPSSIGFQFTYQGWQDVTERCQVAVLITPSLLTGAAVKGIIRDAIADWYSWHSSSDYDPWNGLLDTFTLLGGVL